MNLAGIPMIDTLLIETIDPYDLFRARKDSPITPDKVLKALKEKRV